MSIVRMIFVTVKPDQVSQAISLWKNHCAPLMIKQPGCLSEKLLECADAPGEFISYSEWDDQANIDKTAKATPIRKFRNIHEVCKADAPPSSATK